MAKKKDCDVSKILCPFCSSPWTDAMVKIWHESSGCPSGGYDTDAYLDITCATCERLIYRKTTDPYG